jgi:hypothetical protein
MRMHLAQSAGHRRRGGAVIIVVLSLMTTLVFLGLFFFGWSSQEVANAELFADPDDEGLPAIDPYVHLDRAAEQLIVGTRGEFFTSALWGGMHSMLAHEIGQIRPDLTPTDTNVSTGTGIMVRFKDDGNGYPDVNPDGTFDDPDYFQLIYDGIDPMSDDPQNPDRLTLELNLSNFAINYSVLAQPVRGTLANPLDAFTQPDASNRIPFYRPDVDYTYPDINSLFLAHEEVISDPDNPGVKIRVLIPSFFRPQLFPEMRSRNTAGPWSNAFLQLYHDSSYQRKVLRPHKEHQYPGGTPRYLTGATSAQSGNTSRILSPFPFPQSAEEAQMGIFNNVSTLPDYPNLSDTYSLLDVDLDNDGVKDAIWIDLGLPMLTLPGGDQFVPMASFKVVDADGLLNLNAHGNMEGLTKYDPPRFPGDLSGPLEPISVSNLGMSRSEVNPIWALNGDVDNSGLTPTEREAALKNVIDRFGLATVPSVVPPLALANMEWTMLLSGWHPFNSQDATAGRYGEKEYLATGGLPRSGATGSDDDGDGQAPNGYGQIQDAVEALLGLSNRGFVHPLAPTGLGLPGFNELSSFDSSNTNPAYVISGPNGAVRNIRSNLFANNPSGWPKYWNFQRLGGSPYLSDLMVRSLSNEINELVDEADEVILEPGNINYGLVDSPFGPSENAALHLSNSDLSKQPVSSRAKILASANFQHVPNAAQIRSRFTTDSWDRLEFNANPSSLESWVWTNGQFPPMVDTAAGQVQPFRQELRNLLHTDTYTDSPPGPDRQNSRHRLNINKILSDDQRSIPDGHQLKSVVKRAFENGSPRYRDLVPHPESISGGTTSYLLTAMHHTDDVEPIGFHLIQTDPCAQEWWARYDRQRLARDIYCLLWTVGFIDEFDDTLTSEEVETERKRRAREMAQFAVNVVDAMDRDNVITRFEYDPDLRDGWDPDPANLEVAYGIEDHLLTFSEVLLVETASEDEDSERTLHKEEEDKGHRFLYVELRNASPYQVSLADDTWRIVRLQGDGSSNAVDIAVEFKAPSSGNAKAIGAGENFVIGCHDGTVVNGNGEKIGSDFYVNVETDDNDGPLQLIIPRAQGTDKEIDNNTERPDSLLDLDLTPADESKDFWTPTEQQSGFGGVALVEPLEGSTSGPGFTLVLQRKQNLSVQAGSSNDWNEWVEVDRWTVDPTQFGASSPISLGSNPTLATIESQLKARKSQERLHPFTAQNQLNPGSDIRNHSLRAKGDPEAHYANEIWREAHSNDPFPYWQPHFNRDFSSAMELLSVPLYGNYSPTITENWSDNVFGGVNRNLVYGDAMTGHRTAAARILNPQAPDVDEMPLPSWVPTDLSDDAAHYRNRWYRLLEFVDVKSQNDLRMDQITAVHRRTPGKINLNTVRDETVLAGLIDDPYHINPITSDRPTQDQYDAGRNWYLDLRRARDGVDPLMEVAGLQNIFIPGGFRSRPFRSLNHLDAPHLNASGNPVPHSPDLSLNQTVLRRRPTTGSELGLFEARSEGDLSENKVDFHTRNRLLAKIHNNSTTRSHVYFAWIGIDFFEAHYAENNPALIQIGGLAEDLPRYRMFCVIDMSRIEEAYNPETGTFDFRKFIIHRQLLP